MIALVSGVAMLLSSAVAQAPLQFNVPYTCQDGLTRIITRCEKNARLLPNSIAGVVMRVSRISFGRVGRRHL